MVVSNSTSIVKWKEGLRESRIALTGLYSPIRFLPHVLENSPEPPEVRNYSDPRDLSRGAHRMSVRLMIIGALSHK